MRTNKRLARQEKLLNGIQGDSEENRTWNETYHDKLLSGRNRKVLLNGLGLMRKLKTGDINSD